MKFSLYDWYRQTIRNPKYRWWIVLGTIAYLVMPFDIAPDFLPVIGQIDDVLIVSLLVSEVSQMLIERVKASKSGKSVQDESARTVDSATTTEPVDVNAVSID
ncbi:MAG TPA: YkvA family protein [Crinalium sp.]|jgi:uncharacterized membrane protein YkvA (DUF1232 family)